MCFANGGMTDAFLQLGGTDEDWYACAAYFSLPI